MLKSFNLPPGIKVRDPRIIMRVVIGVLLVANLAAAIAAFKPFGGSADDLRRDQDRLSAQFSQMRDRIAKSRQLVDKVSKARVEGDEFLSRYFMDVGTASTTVLVELTQTATDAGIKMGQAQFDRQPIEGSDTLVKETMTIGFEGNYANLTKFIHLVDKSPRFLIIESMQAAAPQQQGGQNITVTLKIVAFIRDLPGVPTGAAL